DYAYDSRAKVNLADLWSAPGDLTPQQRQQQQLQRQQQAQQQAQHRRDQLNAINALSGGHFDQLDATDKMGIAVQLTLGILFSSGTLAPVLGPAIAFFTSVMATVGPWAIEFAEVALVLQGLVLIKNLIDAATAQTADQLYTASEKMTEDAKNAGQMALQVGMAEIMGGGGEGPEA